MARTNRWVYFFGGGKADGSGADRALLGGKGAGLAEMTRIGLPVPAGFTITTDTCASFHKHGGAWPTGLEKETRAMLARLEKLSGKKLGGADDPLLVSVRSGAAQSMPGMMETILNLGLNDTSVEGLARVSSSRRFAFDSYRRFIMMYGATAKGLDRTLFDEAFEGIKDTQTRRRLGRSDSESVVDTDVNSEELEATVALFKRIYRDHGGEEFPQDPFEQLKGAIDAVFGSWMSEKAVTFRRVEHISGLNGTAVNVCRMVFGNMGDDCGTGVCFTRDPSTGEPCFYGDLLINAQGEDVVAGVRTPVPLVSLRELMPDVYDQLEAVRVILEVHYKEMQDLEFTIERGTLYMLQCRTGKRSPAAAFRIAVDQATSGLLTAAQAKRLVALGRLPKAYARPARRPVISKDEAIARITAEDVERLFLPVIHPNVPREELAAKKCGTGIGAVPGAAYGRIAFSAEQAERMAGRGETAILVRKETSPEDVGGMYAAAGILTATGGKTSHAAVVARGWGKCCIVGCSDLIVDYGANSMSLNGAAFSQGDAITLDGGSGTIFRGEIALDRPDAPPEYETIMSWCDARRRLKVRTNADTPADARKAVAFGAEGIGLCRTEHMFFDPSQPERIRAMREMILAQTVDQRKRALAKLLPHQREDFEGIFEAMDAKPVTIRLLDPPLHEFLPHHDNPQGQADVVSDLNEGHDPNDPTAIHITLEDVQRRVDQLHESNPMLGHRGCRLSITFPEILEMQVAAIIEAAVNCAARGVRVLPEIMIPLCIDAHELAILIAQSHEIADGIISERNSDVAYLVGTMIETPRAALVAGEMAAVAEFFSFGTNDLTQMTMALSRDDAGRFFPEYMDEDYANIFAADPFQTIDTAGVGQLVQSACHHGRLARPGIKLGVCGEHGGDPASIQFFANVGLDYVSCSPYRVPVARLAAAQAQITRESSGPDKKRPARKRAVESTGKKRPSKKKKKKAQTKKSAAKRPGARTAKKKATPRKKAAAKKKLKKTVKRKAAGPSRTAKRKAAKKKRAPAKKRASGKAKAKKKAGRKHR
ncbi:MAG: putative PEP-binding protein [Phycisphaerae bacterium]